MFISTKTSNSLPEPGAVAHDCHKSVWILQCFGVWQRAIFSQCGTRRWLYRDSSWIIRFIFSIPSTQQEVNQGLLSRTWTQGNKLWSSVIFYKRGKGRCGLQKCLSFPSTRCIVLTVVILVKGENWEENKWEFHRRRIFQLQHSMWFSHSVFY